MTIPRGQTLSDAHKIVDNVIAKVGTRINLGTPLALGKPNLLLNVFYQRAKQDPSIDLTITTALTLERPKGRSLLERRFLDPFTQRVFGDYPDLEYEIDRVKQRLPANVRIIEFYYPAGKFLHNSRAQQDFISSNYTHVARDMMDRGANVIAQMIAAGDREYTDQFSLSCNPDVTLDLLRLMEERRVATGVPYAVVGQLNRNLPFMYGDAVVDATVFDWVLDTPAGHYTLFGTPKLPVPLREHVIGIYLSALIRDDGELQVGIGALGDAFVNAMVFRQTDNVGYQQLLHALQVEEKFAPIVAEIGATGCFTKGLFGATEMVVDGFLHLYRAGILKRVVYDDLPLQRLLNEGLISHAVTGETLRLLLQRKAIHLHLSAEDFRYLVEYGVFREGLTFENGFVTTPDGEKIAADFSKAENFQRIARLCLGKQLKRGAVAHGGFFLGPQDFYRGLRELPESERRLFNMRSVQRINQLYGHEPIDRLQRKNARFVNTCMMVTLSGAIISDGLEDGRVVSGVGGQYNFVAMAHALPDGRSLMNLRATRQEGRRVVSNIVWNYGHTTIPRHLRDIVVTEYGIANLRGKTDGEIIEELLKITDSRFQDDLVAQAKRAGKLRADYAIPAPYRENYPAVIEKQMAPFVQKGLLPRFPFGTDFTEDEQTIGAALKLLKRASKSKWWLAKLLLRAVASGRPPEELRRYLERMGLWEVHSLEERLMRGLLVIVLTDTGAGA